MKRLVRINRVIKRVPLLSISTCFDVGAFTASPALVLFLTRSSIITTMVENAIKTRAITAAAPRSYEARYIF